ncbi:MAG: hypothetical protein KIT84_29630 [Labilithrix sp.]|nr:hypothetical protein [Labilithrix sp.]MCW5815224.1 hypothetical protein [Labilithrix sp.]
MIRTAAEAIRHEPTRAEDPSVVAHELARASKLAGITPEAFDRAIDLDPELELLKITALIEAVAGSTDPGPHDAISRESPSGKPGDLTKEREHPERRLHHDPPR